MIFSIFCKNIKDIKFENDKFIFNLLRILIILVILKVYGEIYYNCENKYVFPVIIGIFTIIFFSKMVLFQRLLSKFSNLGNYMAYTFISFGYFNNL